jgi:hypothetical protein
MAEEKKRSYGYRLPKSDFALPGKGEGPKGAGAGSYPIDTNAFRARPSGAQHARGRRLIPNLDISGGKRKHPLHDHPSSQKI